MNGELNSFEPPRTPVTPAIVPDGSHLAFCRQGPVWKDLFEKARSGSPAAVGQLLEQCRGYLTVIVQQEIGLQLRAKVAPSDLVQESMLDAYRGFGKFQGSTEKELLGWLRRILFNNLVDATRQYRDTAQRAVERECKQNGDSDVEDPLEIAEAPSSAPFEKAIRNEEEQHLLEAISRLPARQCRVVILRNLKLKPFIEIGQLMQISPDAARKLWERAIQRLTEDLKADDRFTSNP